MSDADANNDRHTASSHPSTSVSSASTSSMTTRSPSPRQYSVLAVGILTSDVVFECPYYPTEDESLRATKRHIRAGGNASNSLRIFSQLATSPLSLPHMTASSTLLASLGSAATTATAVESLHSYGIDTSHCPSHSDHPLPTSYIVNSQRTGSRTIVHYRGGMPEVTAAQFTSTLAHSHTLYHFGRPQQRHRHPIHDEQTHTTPTAAAAAATTPTKATSVQSLATHQSRSRNTTSPHPAPTTTTKPSHTITFVRTHPPSNRHYTISLPHYTA